MMLDLSTVGRLPFIYMGCMASYHIALRVAVMFHNESLDQSWLPGRSVGHTDGQAGSLGLFVDVTRETKLDTEHDPDTPMTAFVSAAHVLAPPTVKKADIGDFIFSPCPPFAKPVGTNRRAKLVNFIQLKISPTIAQAKAPTNEGDLAVAALQRPAQVHNRVRKPQLQDGSWKAGDLIQLATLVNRDQLTQIVEKKAVVFKIGRSTGFSWGVLQSKDLSPLLLKLPDGSPIYYKNLCCVTSEDPHRPFADSGDSGAVIYTEDLQIVGFVVGSRGNDTYFYHAEPALSDIGAVYQDPTSPKLATKDEPKSAKVIS